MNTYLGEDGTEQFTVESRVDGRLIREQRIHDPFIHSSTVVVLGRWSAFKQFLRPSPIKVEVTVRGSHAAQRRIMMMDPEELQRENIEWVTDKRAGVASTLLQGQSGGPR